MRTTRPSPISKTWEATRRADPLRQLDQAVAAEVAGHEQELVAAPAHDDVGFCGWPPSEVAELPEHRVARGVAGGVVDRLEVVEVDHHEGQVEESGVIGPSASRL